MKSAKLDASQGYMLVNFLKERPMYRGDPTSDNNLHFKAWEIDFNGVFFFFSQQKYERGLTFFPAWHGKGSGVIIAEEIPKQVLKQIYFHAPV